MTRPVGRPGGRLTHRLRGLLSAGLGSFGLLLAGVFPLVAQAETLRNQTLGRPYWHVFLAYAITLVLILGWVVSIARRLRRVETRLQSDRD
jgi:hypothetical protein